MPAYKGVPPRVKDEKEYYKRMKRSYLDPLLRGLEIELSKIPAGSPSLSFITAAQRYIDRWVIDNDDNFPTEEVRAWAYSLNAYNEKKLIMDFKRAVKVDVKPALQRAGPLGDFLEKKVKENIDLIQTLPQRLKDDLIIEYTKAEREAPFDQRRKEELIRKAQVEAARQDPAKYDQSYKNGKKKADYNLRRITRDQSNKLNGQLALERMRILGIKQYKWKSSQDDRVRASHRSLNGEIFEVDSDGAEGEGHPGEAIQCRCVALQHIDLDELNRKMGNY